MITLFTAPSPNGHKVSIALEELGLEYSVREINLVAGEHRSAEFLQVNPNAKIPALIDSETGVEVFESGAILLYLAEKYGRLLPLPGDPGRWEVIKWLMFQMSGIGPMQGQSVIFFRYFEEKLPAAISRYHNECYRLWRVVEGQLEKHSYIAGDEYSLADIAIYPWYRAHGWAGIDLANDYPMLVDWAGRLAERPAVGRGMQVPHKLDLDALQGKALEAILDNARKLVMR